MWWRRLMRPVRLWWIRRQLTAKAVAMSLTEQDLTDLEIADSVGDFGRNSKVSDAVDELRLLRTRVAELEALNAAAARATDALENIGEQARQRIVDLAAALREACDMVDSCIALGGWGSIGMQFDRLRKLADRAAAETRAGGQSQIGGQNNGQMPGAPMSTPPTSADPAFYLHRLDTCRCGRRRGDHEGSQPQPCPETGCTAFALAEAHDARAMPLEVVATPAPAPDLLPSEERARRTRLAWWADLTGEERLALIGQCCSSCVALDPSCRCGDDS